MTDHPESQSGYELAIPASDVSAESFSADTQMVAGVVSVDKDQPTQRVDPNGAATLVLEQNRRLRQPITFKLPAHHPKAVPEPESSAYALEDGTNPFGKTMTRLDNISLDTDTGNLSRQFVARAERLLQTQQLRGARSFFLNALALQRNQGNLHLWWGLSQTYMPEQENPIANCYWQMMDTIEREYPSPGKIPEDLSEKCNVILQWAEQHRHLSLITRVLEVKKRLSPEIPRLAPQIHAYQEVLRCDLSGILGRVACNMWDTMALRDLEESYTLRGEAAQAAELRMYRKSLDAKLLGSTVPRRYSREMEAIHAELMGVFTRSAGITG